MRKPQIGGRFLQHAQAVSAARRDPDRTIARLTAERDALQVRLEKAIDVRNNLAAWNEDARARIAALTETLAKVRRQLPDREALQEIRKAAGRRRRSAGKLASRRSKAEPVLALCRVIERLRALLPDAAANKRAVSGSRAPARIPQRFQRRSRR